MAVPALLAAASAGLVVLGAALAARLVFFRSSVAADIQAPDRVFGFFTITAGLDVLGVRLASRLAIRWPPPSWLPSPPPCGSCSPTACPPACCSPGPHDSVLGGVNGSWLLWIVATQSLSIAAAVLVPAWPSQTVLLAPVAAGLWCVGLLLYLMVVALILLRWLTVPLTPATLGPPYWILMGATAISVLAGARDLALPAGIPVVRATAGFVEGFTFALWAFGTWWIPLLIILGLWRHVRRHWPLTYEPTLWSVVFPLGMYSVATLTFGKAAHLAFMEPLARFMLWVAVAAWALVATAFLARLVRHPHEPSSGSPTPSRHGAGLRHDHGEEAAVTVALITEAHANCMETVADVMVRHPKLCHEDSTVGDVRQLFADDHLHAVLIMSGTRLLTVLDRADLGPEATDSAPAARLGRLSGRVTTPTAPADTALQQMIAANRRRLAVLGPDGTLLGLPMSQAQRHRFLLGRNVHQRRREHLQQRITGASVTGQY